MTTQKPHKWHDLIVAWAGGARVERRRTGFREWYVFTIGGTPNWDDPDWEFRLHDPYREFREAQEQGKVVEYFSSIDNNWISDPAGFEFCFPPDRYRIAKPEPKEEELYMLVSERDGPEGIRPNRRIVHEQYLDKGAGSLEKAKLRRASLADIYGKTRIAKLHFIE